MREFQKWAKTNDLNFKRRRDERSAFEVWKVCQAEKRAIVLTMEVMKAELLKLQSMLQEIGHTDNV